MADPQTPDRFRVIPLLLFLTACYAVGFVGSLAVNPALSWYVTITRPTWSAPVWVFGPLWTILYGLMGWAAWIIWSVPEHEQPSGRRTRTLTMFFVQLVLNGCWSWIFFGWHLMGVAVLEIGLLWFAILTTTVMFYRIRPLAGGLMIPYLLWTAFAAALNIAIYRLNQ